MKLEKQVCNLKQAQRLKELGVNCKSQFYWHPVPTKDGEKWQLWPKHMMMVKGHIGLPAFTVAELGVLLTTVYEKTNLQIGYNLEEQYLYIQRYGDDNDIDNDLYNFNWSDGETEAEARAGALIWLLENGFIQAEDLKL